MYELFVLGELLDQPLHGYLLRDIINRAIGPTRQMSWGALYPLMRRLVEEGFIELVEESKPSGRPRKVYHLTSTGEARFHDLMLRPEEYNADYPDTFHIKLVNFDHLGRDQQLGVLSHYRGYVQFLLAHLQAAERSVQISPLPEAERPYVLRAVQHRLYLADVDLVWIDAEIEHLSAARH